MNTEDRRLVEVFMAAHRDTLGLTLSENIRLGIDAIIEECARIVESQKPTDAARFGGNKWGAAGAMQMVCAAAVRSLKRSP